MLLAAVRLALAVGKLLPGRIAGMMKMAIHVAVNFFPITAVTIAFRSLAEPEAMAKGTHTRIKAKDVE